MNFISRNPDKTFSKVTYKEAQILVNAQDVSGETISRVRALCDQHHLNTNAGFKCKRFYYLRGIRWQAPYGQVLTGFLETEVLPSELFEIVHCLSFWNQEAQRMYAINAHQGETLQNFVLRCIAADCRAFVKPYAELFITDRDETQVWVSHRTTEERILLIQFLEDRV
ncbi:hypothetical protein ACFQZX_00230 [Mucilaginibacter litoreus]|uniref:Uncharacterized protein n=1 Tax=Mucilaginibacter litoreus TaxID=1048221 RepID=A0ABW3ALZ6_9SPHI